jgi:PAS domain S-box-containing protein
MHSPVSALVGLAETVEPIWSPTFFQTVIDAIPDALLVIGRDYHILLANRAAREMSGEADLTSGLTCYRLSHHRDAPCTAHDEVCPLHEVIATKAPVTVTHTHYDANDNKVFVEISAAPVFNKAGEVACIIEVCRDVTDRKRVEESLRLTQFSVDHAADPVFWVRPDASFAYANARACVHLGYSQEELLTLTVHDIDPNFPAEVWPAHWEKLKRQGSATFESQHRAKDGRLVPVEITVNFVAFAGKEYNCASARYISERKQAEQSLQQTADELARSNRELEQFACTASHDLQEPLRMVSGFVELLRREHGERLDAEAQQYIRYAVDGANRMQTLIRDLLAYARVGRQGGALLPTDAGTALKQALANLRASIEETNAEIAHGELPQVRGDGSQLVQLFQNLLSNAIKFHGEAPPKIRVAASRRDDQWVFAVHDNGIGIAPQFQDRIFLIFERLHKRSQYAGTGVGLAICKKIVERHGGRIWVESQPGQGATFCFTLPSA